MQADLWTNATGTFMSARVMCVTGTICMRHATLMRAQRGTPCTIMHLGLSSTGHVGQTDNAKTLEQPAYEECRKNSRWKQLPSIAPDIIQVSAHTLTMSLQGLHADLTK